MRNEIVMDVLYARDDLFEVEFGLVLVNIVILYEVIEFSIAGQLHDNEDIVGRVQHFVELDDVGMVNEFQYLYFSFHLICKISTLEIMFLFRIFLLLMIFTATFTPVMSWRASINHSYECTFDFRESACPNCLPKDIMPDMHFFHLLCHFA